MSDKSLTLTQEQIEIISLVNILAGLAIANRIPRQDIYYVCVKRLKEIYPSKNPAMLEDAGLHMIPVLDHFFSSLSLLEEAASQSIN